MNANAANKDERQRMTEQEMVEQIPTIMISGQDTTVGLKFTFVFISDKICREIHYPGACTSLPKTLIGKRKFAARF